MRTGASRRLFLGGLSSAGLLTWAAPAHHSQTTLKQRVKQSYDVRTTAARRYLDWRDDPQPVNSDESTVPAFAAAFSKGLPHDNLGLVDSAAYQSLLQAASLNRAEDWAAIPMGGSARLVNPQATAAYNLEGFDSWQLQMPAPPAFSSEAASAELVELYWRSLVRDTPFSDYDSSPLIDHAARELDLHPGYSGPRIDGRVTPQTLFRAGLPGETSGPFLSQFLCLPFPYGTARFTQRYPQPLPAQSFVADYSEWLGLQRGGRPAGTMRSDPEPRYIRNQRDLAMWVWRDYTFQAFLNAALYLLSLGPSALKPDNPYRISRNQAGFTTFGGPMILDLVSRAGNAALRAAWVQKWLHHRRLRPETMAGRLHNHITNAYRLEFPASLTNSRALEESARATGNFLLPQAYPEGAPLHPSYPGGHSAISGACTTILKAFFDESLPVPNAETISADGLSTSPWTGEPLTVGGELNKLASNVTLGRDAAGIHYRSDGIGGIVLGESVAVGILQDALLTCAEPFDGFRFTRFDGSPALLAA